MNEWEAPRDECPPMSYYDGLYHEYATGLLRLCYYYLGSREQAEDVVQDVFVRLISSGIAIKPGSEKAYLLRAVVNHCKDVWRSAWARRMVFGSAALELTPDPRDVQDGLEKAELMKAVNRLRPDYREVILLFYYQNCTIEQIAQVLNVPSGTVSSRLTRGRQKLRDILEGK